MTFWTALKATYRDSFAFLIACPLLALVPVAVELIQHWAEVHIGMYDSLAMAKAVENHPLRMAFGFVKVLSLTIPGYWVARFLAWRSPALAGRWDGRAVALFSGFVAFHAVTSALQLFVLPRTGPALLIEFVVGAVLSALLVAWAAAAPLGNAAIGPFASVRLMAPRLIWTVGFMLVAMLPLMIPHYALGAAAIMGPKPLLWPVLILDSLLVGWLAALIVASGWYAALRAADRAGVALVPPAPAGTGASHPLHGAA
jgi:hypothetical protein